MARAHARGEASVVLRWRRCAGRGRGLGLYPRVPCVVLWRSVFPPGFIQYMVRRPAVEHSSALIEEIRLK